MPFFQHLAELRRRLAFVILFVFFFSLVLYFVWKPIYDTLMIPITPVLQELHIDKPIATGVFEIFIFRFKVALFGAILLGSPLIAYQTMAFFLPALKEKERRWFVPGLLSTVFFFLLGAGFCWGFILRPGFLWLLTQGGDVVRIMPMADKLLSSVLLFMLAFGIGFETPVVVFLLIATGMVPYQKMRKNWRIAYLVISIVSAVVTPDWSWISMGSLAVAMIVLYEGAMAASWLVLRKRIKAEALAEAGD
ncbi:MAG TPA: twin-arginine translocase subunit TatC [Coriobacteriia bacterium]|jgi:sec-independent protein translocase protein TatC